MTRELREYALVGAQLAAIGGLCWPARPRWQLPAPLLATAAVATTAGGALLLLGVRRQGRQLSPYPSPSAGAVLRTDGVYALSRNPMYGGGLLAAAGVAVLRRGPEPLVALGALGIALNVKIGCEERLLRARFGAAYDEYVGRVPRLLPVPRLRRRSDGGESQRSTPRVGFAPR